MFPTFCRLYPRADVGERMQPAGCGFSFGSGCSEGTSDVSLFGSDKRRTIPIKAEI